MAENCCVVYRGPGEVAVEDIGYPGLELPGDVEGFRGQKKGPSTPSS